jgi:hypothetical protein
LSIEGDFEMNAKLHKPALASIFGALSLAVVACGQGADPSSTEPSSESTTDALTTVVTCQQDAFACQRDAQVPTGLDACQKELQACLMSLFPAAPSLPGFDGGVVVPKLPSFDAGLPKLPNPTPVPTITPPTLPDAGLPRLPDAGVPADAQCLATLQSCLLGGTMPTTCASDAQTCLTAAAKARCDAQEAQCVKSGAPAAVCQQLRMACR